MSQRIIVGVDDSAGGRAALRWALIEAALRDASLEVVHAWSMGWSEGFNPEWFTDRDVFEQQAKDMVQKLIDEVAADLDTVVPTTVVVIEGDSTTSALLSAAKGADLLVVGSRGRSALTAMALGSVSAACVHRARMPIAVIPPPSS